MTGMLEFERQLWQAGCIRVAGVDEAGRGPLAGPVLAAAVVLDADLAAAELDGAFKGLTDSKKLSPARRTAFHDLLRSSPHVTVGVGRADRAEIDGLNILRATHLAMARAVADLPALPEHVLVDGRAVSGLPCASTAIVGGDGRSLSIAAGSVVAKVVRDTLMESLDVRYPQYGFAKHKGYGSRAHVQALFEHGPCPEHRLSFRPVREAAAILAHRAAQQGSA